MAQLKSSVVQGNLSVTGLLIADKIIKSDGTSTQLLLANGEVISTSSFLAATGKAAALNLTSAVGDTKTPVYFSAAGVPVTLNYTIEKSVPANAVFTDASTTLSGHYSPTEDTNSLLQVDASSTTAATWGSTQLVTGVNIKRDAKGHVTGITVDSIKMPANPNSNTAHSHAAGTGLVLVDGNTGGTSGTVTYKVKLNSETSLGTIGSTSKLYAVGVDANGKLCVNVPWTDNNTDTKVTTAARTTSQQYKITAASGATTGSLVYDDTICFGSTAGELIMKLCNVNTTSAPVGITYDSTRKALKFVVT